MNKENSYLDGFFILLAAFLGFIALSDLLGRLHRRFVLELPFIGVGLAILLAALVFYCTYAHFAEALEKDKANTAHALKNCKDDFEFTKRSMQQKIDEFQSKLRDYKREVTGYHYFCKSLIDTIEKAAEQKTPIITTHVKAPDATVQKAENEFIGGDKQ